MSGFLFLLRAYPDVDHLAPLAWKVLEQGERAVVVFELPYPAREDYRLRFLAGFPGFELLELPGIASRRYPAVLAGRLRWRGRRLDRLLDARQIGAVIVDWGHGAMPWSRLREPLPRPWDPRFWWRAIRAPMTRLRVLGDEIVPRFRATLLATARRRSLPVFCLPHGVQVRTTLKGPPPGWRPDRGPFDDGRRGFTACVFPSELEREHQVQRFRLDPARAHVWGSMRFSPEWDGILRRICPRAPLPPCQAGQVRVVFYLPQWTRRADAEGTFALIRDLAARSDVQLVLRAHARPGRADVLAPVAREIEHGRDVILTEAHAPALIAAADAVIVVNSSVALEALLQQKPLIYPAYLHGNRLVFDEFGGSLRAAGPADVHRFLDAIAAGSPSVAAAAEVEQVLRMVVYAGREPFDVLGHYYTEIRRLMNTSPDGPSGANAASASITA